MAVNAISMITQSAMANTQLYMLHLEKWANS